MVRRIKDPLSYQTPIRMDLVLVAIAGLAAAYWMYDDLKTQTLTNRVQNAQNAKMIEEQNATVKTLSQSIVQLSNAIIRLEESQREKDEAENC